MPSKEQSGRAQGMAEQSRRYAALKEKKKAAREEEKQKTTNRNLQKQQ